MKASTIEVFTSLAIILTAQQRSSIGIAMAIIISIVSFINHNTLTPPHIDIPVNKYKDPIINTVAISTITNTSGTLIASYKLRLFFHMYRSNFANSTIVTNPMPADKNADNISQRNAFMLSLSYDNPFFLKIIK